MLHGEGQGTEPDAPSLPNDEALQIYLRLSRSTPNRLTVSTFLAGFTLAAFVALFSSAQTIDHVNSDTVVLFLADAFLGIATLLFLVTTTATYVAMQRIAGLSAEAMRSADTAHPTFTPTDAVTLQQAETIFLEPATFIVWGLLLIVASLLLVGWHVSPGLSVVLFLGLVVLMVRAGTLRTDLKHVLTSRTLDPWDNKQGPSPPGPSP